MAKKGQPQKSSKTLIGLVVTATLGVASYFVFGGLLAGGPEDGLASAEPETVIETLAKLDTADLADKKNADLRKQAVNTLRQGSMHDMFERMRSNDMSEEERHQLMSNMRTLMEEEQSARAREWAEADSEEKKNEILDKQLDEMLARRAEMEKEWEKRRAEREKERAENGGKDDERRRDRGPRRTVSTQERKQRLESSNPDDRARTRKFHEALRKRAEERGVSMGRGFGGPGRRGGGGPGGGGGRGRGGR